MILFLQCQCERLKELIKKVKDELADKDNKTGEEIKSSTSELQQASLKLFEVAYKKVRYHTSCISNLKYIAKMDVQKKGRKRLNQTK